VFCLKETNYFLPYVRKTLNELILCMIETDTIAVYN